MSTLREILVSMNLSNLIPRFEQEGMDINIVAAASDDDFKRLGVSKLGDRIRLREKCKQTNQNVNRPAFRVLEERRNLFAPYSTSSRKSKKNKPTKQKTWTAQFFCLSSRDAEKLPTATEKQVLHNAGLGYKKIVFNLDDDEESVYRKIMGDEGFPALKNCGGFEFLKCVPNCRILEPLQINISVHSLKSTIGQGKLFLRPIQKNLSAMPVKKEHSSSIAIKECCIHCSAEFHLDELRQHSDFCSKKLKVDLTEEEDELDEDILPQMLNLQSSSSLATNQENTEETDREEIQMDQSPVEDLHIAENQNTAPLAFNITYEAEQASNTKSVVPFDINLKVTEIVEHCISNAVQSPVEILRFAQKHLIQGRSLEVVDITVNDDRPTNFIMVDRSNLLETGMDEIKSLENKFICLSVQFYEEV